MVHRAEQGHSSQIQSPARRIEGVLWFSGESSDEATMEFIGELRALMKRVNEWDTLIFEDFNPALSLEYGLLAPEGENTQLFKMIVFSPACLQLHRRQNMSRQNLALPKSVELLFGDIPAKFHAELATMANLWLQKATVFRHYRILHGAAQKLSGGVMELVSTTPKCLRISVRRHSFGSPKPFTGFVPGKLADDSIVKTTAIE